MKKRIGAFVGKFYPPHKGHKWAIEQALKRLDEVYVIISKNTSRNKHIANKDNFEVIDAELIKSWFEKHFANNSKVKVKIFDETDLKPYPQDKDVWANRFKQEFPQVNVKIADESYRQYNQEFFPEYEFFAIERDVVKIHSTDIRGNLKHKFDYILEEAKPYFKKYLKEVNDNEKRI